MPLDIFTTDKDKYLSPDRGNFGEALEERGGAGTWSSRTQRLRSWTATPILAEELKSLEAVDRGTSASSVSRLSDVQVTRVKNVPGPHDLRRNTRSV